jgi:hypothetical protein
MHFPNTAAAPTFSVLPAPTELGAGSEQRLRESDGTWNGSRVPACTMAPAAIPGSLRPGAVPNGGLISGAERATSSSNASGVTAPVFWSK